MGDYGQRMLQSFCDCTGLCTWLFDRAGRLASHVTGGQHLPMGMERASKAAANALEQLQKQAQESYTTFWDYPRGPKKPPVYYTACYLCPGFHDAGTVVFGPYASSRECPVLPYKPLDAARPLVMLLRSLAACGLPEPSPIKCVSDNYHVRKMEEYLLENCHKDISIAEMSRFLGVSKPYLCRLFKQETGSTILRHIHCLRLEKSRLLMADPALSLTDISMAVGYKNQSHFVRHFKALAGKPPSVYRREKYPQACPARAGGNALGRGIS